MKTLTVKSNFKKVSNSDSIHNGEKREPLEWTLNGWEVADIDNASMDTKNKLAVIINDALEKHGRNLLLKNSEDWSYIPSESDTSVDSLYADLVSTTTRKRKVTKEALELAGKFYSRYAQELLGKSEAQGNAGNKVIQSKLQIIAAKPDAIEAMNGNILALLDALESVDSESNSDIITEFEDVAEVFGWLLTQASKLLNANGDIADML